MALQYAGNDPVLNVSTTGLPDVLDVDSIASDPLVEIERLRALLDQQPSCLLRVAHDGTLLAVNDAALRLLGARQLAQALETTIVARIDGDAARAWSEFVERVASGSASIECDLLGLDGARRAVVMQGVSIPHHPDAVPSLLVAVRDVSARRRLEASLHAQEQLLLSAPMGSPDALAHMEQMRQQLEHAGAERHELRTVLDTMVSQRLVIAAALKELTTAVSALLESTALAQLMLDKSKLK